MCVKEETEGDHRGYEKKTPIFCREGVSGGVGENPDLKVTARTHTAIKAKSCSMKRWLWVCARTWDVCQHAYAT